MKPIYLVEDKPYFRVQRWTNKDGWVDVLGGISSTLLGAKDAMERTQLLIKKDWRYKYLREDGVRIKMITSCKINLV